MIYFTPISGVIGGSLIGLSSAILLLGNGDILGASGIVSSIALHPQKALQDASLHWKLNFIASFMLASYLYVNITDHIDISVCDSRQKDDVTVPCLSPLSYIIAGFLVGFGTTLGNGCTSGHGICGLARLSKRSFVAVCTFMMTGILTASFIVSPTSSFAQYTEFLRSASPQEPNSQLGSILTFIMLVYAALTHQDHSQDETSKQDDDRNNKRKVATAIVSGGVFAVGLAVSGMIYFSKLYGFLNVTTIADGMWDPTLMVVMCGGLLVSLLSYQFVKGHAFVSNPSALSCPLSLEKNSGQFNVPKNKIIDAKLILGAASFGAGWGLGGLCPGPAIFAVASGIPNITYNWWPAFIVGAFVSERFFK